MVAAPPEWWVLRGGSPGYLFQVREQFLIQLHYIVAREHLTQCIHVQWHFMRIIICMLSFRPLKNVHLKHLTTLSYAGDLGLWDFRIHRFWTCRVGLTWTFKRRLELCSGHFQRVCCSLWSLCVAFTGLKIPSKAFRRPQKVMSGCS